MTVKELLADKKTSYLFTQKGWHYYSCGSRFYKTREDIVLPAEKTLLA